MVPNVFEAVLLKVNISSDLFNISFLPIMIEINTLL